MEHFGLSVAMDARLDNAADVRRSLDLPSSSPEELLVAAGYRRWGTAIFERLRGEFACIVWDQAAKTLVVGRDPFSVRPIYYSSRSDGLVVASDPDQILQLGLVALTPDDAMVVDYLSWNFSSTSRSFYRDIRRLPGGHVLTVSPGRSQIVEVRRPRILPLASLGTEEHAREFYRLFEQAVRRRMESPYPVVAHLSGGLDSTSIICMAAQLRSTGPALCPEVLAVAGLHRGLACDEEAFIRTVEGQVQDRVKVECWDGSRADPFELGQPQIGLPGSRFVMTGGTEGDIDIAHRIGARVLLSGTGGDQVGRPVGVLEDALLQRRWGDVWRIAQEISRGGGPSASRTVVRATRRLAPSWSRRLFRRLRRSGGSSTPPWISLAGPLAGPEPESAATFRSRVEQEHWSDLISPRTVLSIEYIQAHALRNGLEARFPFLDEDLVSFALSTPARLWPSPKPQERLHRGPLRSILPEAVFSRRTKADFSSALANKV